MPATLTKGATVRVRRGNTVDTDRVTGGDVKGCRGEVIHAPALMAGPDGKKEPRVLVALDDAPAGAGFVSVPVENVEAYRPSGGTSGIVVNGGGEMSKRGIVRIRTVTRNGARGAETLYRDGRIEFEPFEQ